MEQRYRPWFRLFGIVCLAIAMLSAAPACAPRPAASVPAADASNDEPVPAPTTQPSPAPALPSPTSQTSTYVGLTASLVPLSSFKATGKVAALDPFALLAGNHTHPLVPEAGARSPRRETGDYRRARPAAGASGGLKATAPPLSACGRPPEQVGQADPNLAADAADRRAVLTLINKSSVEICYVYISPSDEDNWGADWLGEDSVPPGKSREFTLPKGAYDVKAEDCDGQVIEEHRNVEISGEMKWTIEDQQRKPEPEPGPVVLNEYLCCGYTVGGTRIWGISYPEGWQVEYAPNNNPNDFVGATFSDPRSSMQVVFIPSGWTPMGTAMDTGDVDQYLDAYAAHRAQQDPGFEEFKREQVPGLSMYRVWSGTWARGDQKFYESFLVSVNEMPYVEGMSRGGLTAMGLRAETSQWNQATRIYEAMLRTIQVEVIGPGGYTPPPPGPSDDPVETGMADEGGAATSQWQLLFCPKGCRWEYVDLANQAAGQQWCCSDGCVGQLSEVECNPDQCYTGSCAY